MNTKTCPHCNEVSVRVESWDIPEYHLDGWMCDVCGKIFFTEDTDAIEYIKFVKANHPTRRTK